MPNYSPEFFSERKNFSADSARVLIPWIVEMLKPQSVVDVGCGSGTWLSFFKKEGVPRLLGMDGPWVREDQLEIPKELFTRKDLAKESLGEEKFDLVVSVEVAEHLPPEAAESFVKRLGSLGDVILFSAAIPGQGGVFHLNEQWQDYWAAIFKKEGFLQIDCVRARFWDDSNVAIWYRQNAFFYVRPTAHKALEILQCAKEAHPVDGISVVHPWLFTEKLRQAENPGIIQLLKKIPGALSRSISYRLGGK